MCVVCIICTYVSLCSLSSGYNLRAELQLMISYRKTTVAKHATVPLFLSFSFSTYFFSLSNRSCGKNLKSGKKAILDINTLRFKISLLNSSGQRNTFATADGLSVCLSAFLAYCCATWIQCPTNTHFLSHIWNQSEPNDPPAYSVKEK